MRTYEFTPFRLARVWADELPPAIYEPGIGLKSAVHRPNHRHVARNRVALELYKMVDTRTVYGLLGAEFEAASEDELVIRVAGSQSDGVQADWSLSSHLDSVCVGLPEVYAHAVRLGAVDEARHGGFRPGVLSFRYAAHGLNGSSEAVFQWLGRAVVRLLTVPTLPETPEDLDALLGRTEVW